MIHATCNNTACSSHPVSKPPELRPGPRQLVPLESRLELARNPPQTNSRAWAPERVCRRIDFVILQKIFRDIGCKRQSRWKLNEQRAELSTKRRHFRQKAIEDVGHIHQATLVSRQLRNLDREAEILRHGRSPASISGRTVRTIERGIDFNSRKSSSIADQVSSSRRKKTQARRSRQKSIFENSPLNTRAFVRAVRP